MPYLDKQSVIGQSASVTYLQQVVYEIQIYPFADTGRNSVISISNYSTPGSLVSAATNPGSTIPSDGNNYILESFSFNNDIFNPIQAGSAKIVQQSYSSITLTDDVKEGDLVFIVENGVTIFTGYVESIQIDFTADGTNLTLNFVNILKQLSIGKVFGTLFDTLQPAQGVGFGTLLDTITSKSLLSYAKSSSLFSVNILKGVNETSDIALTASSQVYVSITPYMTILQVLNKILFPYQRFIYQDSLGNVNIAPISLFNDMTWSFNQLNNSTLSFPYTQMSIKKNAAGVNNFEYATLFNIPIAQGVLGGNQSQQNSAFFAQFSPPGTYYTRVRQLYDSKIFQITDVNIEDLISDPSKIDETLNNISQIVQNVGASAPSTAAAVAICVENQTPKSQQPIASQGNFDVSSLLFNYAARAMAENLIEETVVTITTPRITHVQFGESSLLPLPINEMVNVTTQSNILETTALFCRGYVLSYSASGAIVILNLCKPLSGSAYWVTGPLTNA